MGLPQLAMRGVLHWPSLIASLLPGVAFAALLPWAARDPRFLWIAHLDQWPWQLWVIGGMGGLATAAGIADWTYHRVADVRIGPNERWSELIALGLGGVPTFFLLGAATLADRPQVFLIPILVTLIFTVCAICWDEFVYHRRRCSPFETALHRVLTLGHGVAFLAWMHWVFG